jgi:acylphosphatase
MALQVHLAIKGRVQGVGYRDWAMTMGHRLGLSGWVRNRSDGSVEALIVGKMHDLSDLVHTARTLA